MCPDKNSKESSSPKSVNCGVDPGQSERRVKSTEMVKSHPVTLASSSVGPAKNHKVEGKNKKSLHHKQSQQPQQQQQDQKQQSQSQSQQQVPSQSNRRSQQKNASSSNKTPDDTTNRKDETTNICSSLAEFSKRAQELKADINNALEKQAGHQFNDQPVEVVKLKEDILKLSGIKLNVGGNQDDKAVIDETTGPDETQSTGVVTVKNKVSDTSTESETVISTTGEIEPCQAISSQSDNVPEQKHLDDSNAGPSSANTNSSQERNEESTETIKSNGVFFVGEQIQGYKSDIALANALDELAFETKGNNEKAVKTVKTDQKKKRAQGQDKLTGVKTEDFISDGFEPLNAKLDPDSKFVALVSSLQKQFQAAPHLLEPVCRKLVSISEQNSQLMERCENYQAENGKLSLVKQKLENLCRELQKSNNAIRIESISLIKAEQGKAKDQTTKIQSTLSGVIKLFDENQQRNMSLRQENQELQTKLKSLLDHCDNWEKSVEAALRQRDIENRLIKTELAKANLLKNEEKEKFLGEKQELLHVLSMMQEQQHRIEDQEAKLRSDLSSYASKYDECQAVISKGMSRFQTESKRMLQQIEKSKQDYKALFLKYESCNKKTAQLLEEKKYWDKSMGLANKKVETLEKLCRALRERNAANEAKELLEEAAIE